MKRRIFITGMMICVFLSFALSGCGAGDAAADAGSAAQEESASADAETSEDESYSQDFFAMDTYMTLTAYGENAQAAVEAGIAEIERLDALLSTGDSGSEIYGINESGGGEVSEETAYLIERSLEVYESTGVM